MLRKGEIVIPYTNNLLTHPMHVGCFIVFMTVVEMIFQSSMIIDASGLLTLVKRHVLLSYGYCVPNHPFLFVSLTREE